MSTSPQKGEHITVARNKRARHDYHILDQWEAGLVLTGSEVKSLRAGKANLSDAFAVVHDGELFLINCHIPPYEQANQFNHEPTRSRKLLLHKQEIRRLIGQVERKGLTLVPLELFFNPRGIAKVTVALAKGKQLHDKRDDQRRRDDEREMARAMARARNG